LELGDFVATIKETIARLEKHEAECTIRYENIGRRLDGGTKRFDKLEAMLWGIYPTIIAVFAVSKWMG
tara:strand:- start:93 stop:296 length:204 start_codon:yes stop_codon:yes gene_type:complete